MLPLKHAKELQPIIIKVITIIIGTFVFELIINNINNTDLPPF